MRDRARVSSTRTRIRSSPAIASRISPRAFAARRRRSACSIRSSARASALLDPPAFYDTTVRPRLRTMLAHGTTTLETKTGYALHKPGESGAARPDRRASRRSPTSRGSSRRFSARTRCRRSLRARKRFVDYLIDQVDSGGGGARRRLRRRILRAGILFAASRRAAISMPRGCTACGCACIATRWRTAAPPRWPRKLGVDAVDHCNFIRDARRARDRASAASSRSRARRRSRISTCRSARRCARCSRPAATVALASDYNPGTSPCFNLQTVAYFGRKLFGLSAAEALYGVTRAAAHSLRADAGPHSRRRPGRFRRAADRVARRVRLAVRRQSRRAPSCQERQLVAA